MKKGNEYLEYLELNTLNSYFTLPYQKPFESTLSNEDLAKIKT